MVEAIAHVFGQMSMIERALLDVTAFLNWPFTLKPDPRSEDGEKVWSSQRLQVRYASGETPTLEVIVDNTSFIFTPEPDPPRSQPLFTGGPTILLNIGNWVLKDPNSSTAHILFADVLMAHRAFMLCLKATLFGGSYGP